MDPIKNKILIADDEPDLLAMLESLLSEHFEVVLAKDGQTAKELIDKHNFLLIILDIHLPDITGLQLCQSILDSTELPKPHIVILSGDSSKEIIRKAYALNVDDYIVKPLTPLAFVERMLRLERDILDLENLQTLRKNTLSMADTAMKQASEYGSALELIARLNSISDSHVLAKEVAEYFKSKGYFTAVQLRSAEGAVNYDIDSIQCSEVELKVFNVLHQHGRIYNFGRRTIFNDDHISILVKNMPQQTSHSYGMLIDVAAKLVPAINNRFISLCSEQTINHSVDILSNAMEMVAKGITAMELEKREVIEGVISQISASFHQLELTDVQEEYFISLIENQLHKKTVSNEFLNVRETLDSCLSSITAAQEMTKVNSEDSAASNQSDYQDVELF